MMCSLFELYVNTLNEISRLVIVSAQALQVLLLAAMVFSWKEEAWEGRVHRQDLQ